MKRKDINNIPPDLVDFITLGKKADQYLTDWLNDNPENANITFELIDVWQSTSSLNTKHKYDSRKAWALLKSQLEPERGKSAGILKSSLKYAAVGLITIMFTVGISYLVFQRSNTFSVSYQEMTVPFGSRSKISLPDGSQVWLNAGSKLRYNNSFNSGNRLVRMEGECFFTVVKNPDQPFIVQAPGIEIRAIGTQFNVKAYPDEDIIETTIVEGIVQVQTLKKTKNKRGEITLLANQCAYFLRQNLDNANQNKKNIVPDLTDEAFERTNSRLVDVKQNVKSEIQTSWKDDRLILEKEKLSTLARKLERKYNVTILFTDEKAKNYVFSGVLINTTLEQTLNIISLTSPIQYSNNENTITIRENNKLKKRIK
jgi:transmembrane sensor